MAWSRDELVERFRSERATWQALLAEVEPDRMDEPGPMGDWTFKDLVGHLSSWRNRTVARLAAAGRGEPRPANPWPAEIDDDDTINDWFRQRDTDRSIDDLLADYDGSFERMASGVAGLPAVANPTEAETPGYFNWDDGHGMLESDFFNHLETHADDVRAWLAKD